MSRAHVVTTLRKSARDHIRIAWDRYEGHDFLDLRLFYEDGDQLKPSPKGITVKPSQLAELIAALRSAQLVGRQLSLLPNEEA